MLHHCARWFGHLERTLFADLQRGKDPNQLKSEYLRRFAITARQYNALRIQLQGKIAAIKELIPLHIENQKTRIRKAKKVIANLVKSQPGSKQLHEKRRRLAHLEWRLEQLEADQKAGRVRLCFGSKKLFRAQFYREENGYQSHAEWYADWSEARSRQFFVLGSKDETAGCQGCVAIPEEEGSYGLRLRMPNGVGQKYVILTGVRFAYGQEEFAESLACGRALSYRFLHDEKGWRVFVFAEASPVKPVTDRRRGTIGVDINPDQLVLAEVDRSGNFVGGAHIPCLTYGKSQDQVKAMLGEIAKQVMAVAVGCAKPIVLERLQLEKKKATLEEEGRQRARMLSGFGYRQTKQCLKAAAFRAGVEVMEVNPAYTSTIGAVNYAHRYGIAVHPPVEVWVCRSVQPSG